MPTKQERIYELFSDLGHKCLSSCEGPEGTDVAKIEFWMLRPYGRQIMVLWYRDGGFVPYFTNELPNDFTAVLEFIKQYAVAEELNPDPGFAPPFRHSTAQSKTDPIPEHLKEMFRYIMNCDPKGYTKAGVQEFLSSRTEGDLVFLDKRSGMARLISTRPDHRDRPELFEAARISAFHGHEDNPIFYIGRI